MAASVTYRPLLHWPYARRPGDFREHLEDLYFWGYLDVRPFHSISDPQDGIVNIEHKNRAFKAKQRRWRGQPYFKFSGPQRPYYKSRGRQPDFMELIHYRARLNRDVRVALDT